MDEPGKPTGTQIAFRCSTELRDALQEAADEADRTLASECVRRLRRSFDPHEIIDDAMALVVQNSGMMYQDEYVYTFVLDTLSNIFGSEATDKAATMAHIFGMMFQAEIHAKRRGKSVGEVKVTISKLALDELKEAVAKIERECIVVEEEELRRLHPDSGIQVKKL
jgi:hypothetical protein